MSIIYPLTLPQLPSDKSYSENMNPNHIISQFEAGPIKLRRRGTKINKTFNILIEVDFDQKVIFENWYIETLNHGILSFTWKDFSTGYDKDYRFYRDSKYDISHAGADNFTISFTLEEV